ncbi:hypothetical protein ACLOJK_014084 [Asimina triloba]
MGLKMGEEKAIRKRRKELTEIVRREWNRVDEAEKKRIGGVGMKGNGDMGLKNQGQILVLVEEITLTAASLENLTYPQVCLQDLVSCNFIHLFGKGQ